MRAMMCALTFLTLAACATPSRHPIEEGGSQQASRGADRYLGGYHDTAATRH